MHVHLLLNCSKTIKAAQRSSRYLPYPKDWNRPGYAATELHVLRLYGVDRNYLSREAYEGPRALEGWPRQLDAQAVDYRMP